MPSLKNNVQKIKEKSNVVAHSSTSNSVIETLARIGYVARGAIYFVIGLTALLFASGNGGKTTDPQGAIATIGNQPAGRIFLWIVLFGVICYSLWGFIRAIFNPLHAEHNTKGIAERIGYFFSAIAYALLVLPTYALITGGAKPASGGVQDTQIQHFVALVLDWSFGQLLVGFVGIIVVIIGIYQLYQGIKPGFDKNLILAKLNPSQVIWIKRLGRFGVMSRGLVVAIIGIFLIISAYTSNSSQTKGFDSALISILKQPYGPWLLGIIAIGLIALGIYSLCVSMFYRLRK